MNTILTENLDVFFIVRLLITSLLSTIGIIFFVNKKDVFKCLLFIFFMTIGGLLYEMFIR